MKKINTYSAQYKIIQPHKKIPNPPNPQSFANKALRIKKYYQKMEEFINNIAASRFKQFNL